MYLVYVKDDSWYDDKQFYSLSEALEYLCEVLHDGYMAELYYRIQL